MNAETPILIVPGRGNSGAGHWQTLMEEHLSPTRRVEQDDWDAPDLESWSRRIDAMARRQDTPPLLVAHSFGCLAAAHAQIVRGAPVGATLFVAPADPCRFGLPEDVFRQPLGRPGFLVASDDDPWMSEERAIALAESWGIGHLTLRGAGHINVASGYGRWPLGEDLVQRLRERSAARRTPFRPAPAHAHSGRRSGIRHISK